jgi:hypothetical protein
MSTLHRLPFTMNPWEFNKDLDTAKSYQGFTCYRDLGPGRSLEDAYQVYKHQDRIKAVPGFFREWSWKGEWVIRVLAFDLENDRVRLEAMRLERTEDHDRRIESVRATIEAVAMNHLVASAIVAKMVRSAMEQLEADTKRMGPDNKVSYDLSDDHIARLKLLIECRAKDAPTIAPALDQIDQALGIRQLQEKLAGQ